MEESGDVGDEELELEGCWMLARLAGAIIDAETAVYTNNGKRRDPDLRVLQTFEIRRQQILADGLKKLQSSLAPAAWKAFYAHVDGEDRKGVWRTTFGGPTPGARQ